MTSGTDGDASKDVATISRRRVLAASTALVGSLSGCFVRGESSDLEGEIKVDGSDTVLPHSAALAEEFQWRNNRVMIPVRGSGTGAGFQRFCADETHLQNASRAVLDDERTQCAANGVEFVELDIALDGIAVIAHPDNDWCDCLTVDELSRIWERGSNVETWSDVRPDDPSFPDEEIELFGRDTASGTFDYFTRAITGEIGNVRSDYSASSDTNVIVRGVRGDEHALGFGGAGYYYENEDELKLLGVDNGEGCVKPTRKSVETGSYQPLSRMMYLYIKREELRRPEVREFVRFYFEEVDEEAMERAVEEGYAQPGEELAWTQWSARKVGYYGIPDNTVAESSDRLESAIAEVVE